MTPGFWFIAIVVLAVHLLLLFVYSFLKHKTVKDVTDLEYELAVALIAAIVFCYIALWTSIFRFWIL